MVYNTIMKSHEPYGNHATKKGNYTDSATNAAFESQYDIAHGLEPGEHMVFGENKLTPQELEFIFTKCMQEVVAHAEDAGYKRPVTARELPHFLPGYYGHLLRKRGTVWHDVPRLLDDLSSTWYKEVTTWRDE